MLECTLWFINAEITTHRECPVDYLVERLSTLLQQLCFIFFICEWSFLSRSSEKVFHAENTGKLYHWDITVENFVT